jgi:hypothetical protein
MRTVMVLVGAVGVIVVQVLLVWGYLAVNTQDPFILNPDRKLDENGVAMVMLCDSSADNGREVLTKVPPDKELGPWTRGRTIRGECDIWYHHSVLYRPGAD